MNASRVAVIGVLVVGALLVAVVVLGGSDAHQYKLVFQNAGQIVKGDDVKIGGRPVGKVKKIELTDNNAAEVTVTVDEPYAPLHARDDGARRVRPPSPASRTATSRSRRRPTAQPSSMTGRRSTRTRPRRSSTSTRSWQRSTHRRATGLTKVIQGFGDWYAGKGVEANESSKYFAPSLNATRELTSGSPPTSWRSTASSRTPRRS